MVKKVIHFYFGESCVAGNRQMLLLILTNMLRLLPTLRVLENVLPSIPPSRPGEGPQEW